MGGNELDQAALAELVRDFRAKQAAEPEAQRKAARAAAVTDLGEADQAREAVRARFEPRIAARERVVEDARLPFVVAQVELQREQVAYTTELSPIDGKRDQAIQVLLRDPAVQAGTERAKSGWSAAVNRHLGTWQPPMIAPEAVYGRAPEALRELRRGRNTWAKAVEAVELFWLERIRKLWQEADPDFDAILREAIAALPPVEDV